MTGDALFTQRPLAGLIVEAVRHYLLAVKDNQPDMMEALHTTGVLGKLYAETLEEVRYLKTLDCEFAQGYFFSRPVDCERAQKLLGERRVFDLL